MADRDFLVKNGLVVANGDLTIADKIVHSGDTNTSIRFPAADTVTVETAGAEHIRITSAGNIGFGTNNPSTRLDVSGTVTATAFAGPLTGAVTGNASTATALQTARTIGGVSFDGSANINLPGVNAVGNQNTTGSAATLTTARTISLGGDLSGSATFNGSANVTITATIAADSVALGTDTTGNYVASITNGSYITGGNGGSEGAALTLAVDAATAATASKVVARDASGNFSANTITAALSGNATTATTLQTARTIGGVSFDGSANINLPGVNTTGNQNTTGSAATLTTARTIAISGDMTGTATSFDGSANITISAGITANTIVNADINTSAAIADTKLATISTAGKVSNSATTATNLNTASAIVARDASGNFSANTITAALSGNATTATTLQTARTIAISGDVTATATSFNGSADITISAGITANTIVDADINASAAIADTKLATISTAGKVSNSATTATDLNTASAIVARDASGNFSANTITANLVGNASTVTNGALTTGTLAQFASTTSAQLAGVVSDETGSGALVFGTSPTFTTSIVAASTTMGLFDSTATTVNFAGAATTGNFGYDGTLSSSTTNLSVGSTVSGSTKTVNIGTGGASGSATNINIGSATSGAVGNTVINSTSLIVPGNMSLGASILATTGPILTLGTLVSGGSGFMNGTHTNQLFTGGTGAYMLATVTVALGVITGVTLTWGGNRYSAGDVLTAPVLTTTLATTAASGTGTTATITFAAQAAAPFEVGSQIIVAGVTPTGYNGTFTVTACTTTSVSYANATTGAQTIAGTVKMGNSLTASTIPVATVQGTDLYISSYTSDSIGARIRLEANDTSTVAGQEYGAITFGGRDASARGSGDLALIRGVGTGTSGGSDLQFWTGANGTAPTISAVITSGGNFRLYDSTGTFYSEFSNSPTANRTITIPDGNVTLQTGTMATLAGTETLTNKTISAVTLTGTLTANGSVGTAGQVLTSNSTGIYWSTGGSGSAVIISDTAPSTPTNAQLWFDSSDGTLSIYYGDGTSSQWVSVVSSQADAAFRIKTSNYTASNRDNIIADTSAGSFTVTLPASPTSGQYVTIYDNASWGINNLTIGRNGSTIENIADDFVIDVSSIKVEFIYNGSTWQIYSSVAQTGPGTAVPSLDEVAAIAIALG